MNAAPRAPRLVFAVGNPSRGDDALGPMLAERLEAAALPGVEVLTDFQWQVEHALDLEDRTQVIFVDASCEQAAPFTLQRVLPSAGQAFTTHTLSPSQVLAAYSQVTGKPPPPSLLLGVRASSFELGAEPSVAARRDGAAAWDRLHALCSEPLPATVDRSPPAGTP